MKDSWIDDWTPPYVSNVTDKRFAFLVSTLIDTQLIGFKHFQQWADEVIAVLPEPTSWVLDLAIIRDSNEAVSAVDRFVYSDPPELVSNSGGCDEFVACMFHRYRSGTISWATFLRCSGRHLDGPRTGRVDYSFFTSMLDVLSDANYASDVEMLQVQRVACEYESEIETVRKVLSVFRTT